MSEVHKGVFMMVGVAVFLSIAIPIAYMELYLGHIKNNAELIYNHKPTGEQISRDVVFPYNMTSFCYKCWEIDNKWYCDLEVRD